MSCDKDLTTLTQILSIARAGNSSRAWALFHSSGWDKRGDDPKALTLKARLIKDQAKAASGTERVRLYGEAAAVYSAAADIAPASYPLINAATLAFWGGKPERAAKLAQDTLDLLERNPDDAETAYWLYATRSEALLLLGKETEARAALHEGMAKAPRAWEDHAATIGQFALILAEQGRSAAWLDQYRPPSSLYFGSFAGLDDIGAKAAQKIQDFIDREKPAFAYTALNAGADIMIAEGLLAADAELHIILPCSADRLRDHMSKAGEGPAIKRFDAVIEAAATMNILSDMPGEEERPFDRAKTLANQVAMGQAIRNAAVLQSIAKAVAIVGARGQIEEQYSAWTASDREIAVVENDHKAKDKLSQNHGKTAECAQHLCAILWADNLGGSALAERSVDGFNFKQTSNGYYHISADLTATVSLAQDLKQNSDSIKTSLIFDVVDESDPASFILGRVSDIARAANGGPLLTDYKSAMALTLLGGENSIQEIGELNTAYGPISLWSIS